MTSGQYQVRVKVKLEVEQTLEAQKIAVSTIRSTAPIKSIELNFRYHMKISTHGQNK